MKRFLFVLIILIFGFSTITYANSNTENDTIIEEQEESFGIREFLKEANNYIKDFTSDINISDIFNSAIKRRY